MGRINGLGFRVWAEETVAKLKAFEGGRSGVSGFRA